MAGIEAGSECNRLAPLLSKLADGEATADDLIALRPHLRTCLSCRAALRDYRRAPATAAALFPAAALASPERPGILDLPARLLEGVTGWGQKAHAAVEMASAQKMAAVAASTAALAGGGAAVTVRTVEPPAKEPERTAQERADGSKMSVAPVVAAPPEPVVAAPVERAPSPAELRRARQRARREREEAYARKVERETPAEQQEFEPAFAAGDPADTDVTAGTSASSTSSPSSAPPPASRDGGGAEEFAP